MRPLAMYSRCLVLFKYARAKVPLLRWPQEAQGFLRTALSAAALPGNGAQLRPVDRHLTEKNIVAMRSYKEGYYKHTNNIQ